jgi:lathosterol oxidase
MAAWVESASWFDLSLVVTGFFALNTLLQVAFGYLLERLQRPVWAVPLDPGQVRHEIIGNVVFVLVTSAAFVLALGSGVTRYREPSWLAGANTFMAVAIAFQVYYYGLHRMLHVRPWVRFHRWHHMSRVTTPLSAQSMSGVEITAWAVGYCLIPVLISRVIPISLEGWAAYMFINMMGNIIGHGNVELMFGVPRIEDVAWAANPSVYHALHHARWNGHYAFQSVALDRMFGTEFSDWAELHRRISEHRPLPALSARGDR